MKNKILVYADVTLNIIDGSSVWLVNLAKLLAKNNDYQVDILLKESIRDNVLSSELEKFPNINLIESRALNGEILSPKNINKALIELDQLNNYKSIIIRGENIIYNAVRSVLKSKLIVYLVAFCHDENKISHEELRELSLVYNSVSNILVQTEEMKEYLIKILNVDGSKFTILNPIVFPLSRIEKIPKSICYAGKLSKKYKIEELLDLMDILYTKDPEIKLYFIGNKFDSNYRYRKQYITTRLIKSPNIVYIPELPNNESRRIINKCELGYCFRTKDIDNDSSLEISTKFLEYGIANVPCLVRETNPFKKILGEDYPLFIDDINIAADKIINYFSNPKEEILLNLENSFKSYDINIIYQNIKKMIDSSGNNSKNNSSSKKSSPKNKILNSLFGVYDVYKSFSFNILRNFLADNEDIILYDINIHDFENKLIDMNLDEVYICWDEYYQCQLNDFKYNSEYFGECFKIPSYIIGIGIHNFCLRYKKFFSDDIKIYVKDKSNKLGINVWSGSDYKKEPSDIISGDGQLVESSSCWSTVGERSLKITRVSNNFKWTDIFIGNVREGEKVTFSADFLNLRYDVVAFFVFVDQHNNQSFSQSSVLKSSLESQSFTMECMIGKLVKKVFVRFLIKTTNGFIYIDNLNASITKNFKFGTFDRKKLEVFDVLFKDIAILNDKNVLWYSTLDSIDVTTNGSVLNAKSGYYLAVDSISKNYWKDTFIWDFPVSVEFDILEVGNNNHINISSGVNIINRELTTLGITNFSHVKFEISQTDCKIFVNNNDPIILGHSFNGKLQIGFNINGKLTYKNFLIYR